MGRRQPEGPPPAPVVQRVRIRYAKRGRLRFCSHRDFARAFERSLRRAEVPMAYSAGFHPHPRISYVGAAPTGVGSEAEYLEIALSRQCAPAAVHALLDGVLPDGLDIVEVIDALDCPAGNFAEQMQASQWRLEFADDPATVGHAVSALLARDSVIVRRLTKEGHRELDARAAVISAAVTAASTPAVGAAQPVEQASSARRAILDLVVRQVTPSVRPDDVLAALHSVADFAPWQPPRATRLAQGPLEESGSVSDPFGEVLRSSEDLSTSRSEVAK